MQFQKAMRKRAKLRLALAGPAGSGKTWGALEIAKGLGGKIAVIDTERGSASLYSDRAEFDSLELSPPFSPERCIEAIRAAEKVGYDVLIFDSITHEWNGSGGCLEINDQIAHAKMKGNTWAAWNETTPRHRAFVDAILQSPLHIVATLRSKTETVQEGGKVKKVGMKAEQREGAEYEFTVVLEIEHDRHLAVATKDRTRLFNEPHLITEETGRKLLKWLDSGAAIPPEPTPEERFRAHCKAIEEADTEIQRREAFAAAWTEKGMVAFRDKLKAHYDGCKSAAHPNDPAKLIPGDPDADPFTSGEAAGDGLFGGGKDDPRQNLR